MTVKELKVLHYQNRIAQLKKNPVENANLVRKAERLLRKVQRT